MAIQLPSILRSVACVFQNAISAVNSEPITEFGRIHVTIQNQATLPANPQGRMIAAAARQRCSAALLLHEEPIGTQGIFTAVWPWSVLPRVNRKPHQPIRAWHSTLKCKIKRQTCFLLKSRAARYCNRVCAKQACFVTTSMISTQAQV